MVSVIVNGTFDVIHRGHIELLNYAKTHGDHLIVAIDSDRRVAELKGPLRPINNQEERRLLLANLRSVDQVEIFDSETELENIIATCDIMVKGSDYIGKRIVGSELCKHIMFFERLNDYSSTKKIEDIIARGCLY